METRKVQVTGGSTYTVSLPKEWATDHDVSNGTTVALYPDDGSLVLTPRSETDRTKGVMDVTDLDGEQLARAVMTAYVAGFDVVRLEATSLDADQRAAIRAATGRLMGVEVIEESTDGVVLQDLLDSAELSIENAVSRMRLIATGMLADAVDALIDADDDLARDVIARDDDVDRLFLAVSRIFRATLRSPEAAQDRGLDREDCFDYHAGARQLERVADHAVKIATLARDLETVPEGVADALADLHAAAAAALEDAVDALFAAESDEATALGHAALEAVQSIDGHTRRIDERLRDLDARRAQSLGLVVDSLSRSADYGGNVAETALQNAAPRP